MIVQHITALSNHSLDRDTNGIWEATIQHFKPFQINEGSIEKDIAKTPLVARCTVEKGKPFALFDLLYGETLAYTNVCCFSKEGNNEAFLLLSTLVQNLKFGSPITPSKPQWLYSVPIGALLIPHEVAKLCGEIELYMWYALYRGWKK